MKKTVLLMLLAGLLFGCKKESAKPDINAGLKGEWESNLTTDVIIDNANNAELARVSSLHGLVTRLSFDGTGSVTSVNEDKSASLMHTYSLHTQDGHTFISTQLVGFDPADYEILALSGPDLQIKGVVIANTPYSSNGKNYTVHYERTQFFTKQ